MGFVFYSRGREDLKKEERSSEYNACSLSLFLLYFHSKTPRARLVIVFKNCCLKRCENCGLKSVVEQRVFSVNKTKKCVWYHGLNNIF